jgi:drug/metabolite transporter (DMT)-like permease
LNFEAIFTALLGWRLHREPLGRHVLAALALMSAGGAMLVLTGRSSADFGQPSTGWGAIAVVLATLGWALDNALTRPLADLDPIQVVRYKGGLGALMALALSVALDRKWPTGSHAIALLACGEPATE